MKAYRVKGTTDDVTTCGLCEREDLKSTVAMAALDAEGNEMDVEYFGSDCAAKVAGWTQARVKQEARAADAAAKQAEHEARMKAWEEKDAQEAAAFAAWATDAYGVRIVPSSGGVRHNDVYNALATACKGQSPRRTPLSFLREFLAADARVGV